MTFRITRFDRIPLPFRNMFNMIHKMCWCKSHILSFGRMAVFFVPSRRFQRALEEQPSESAMPLGRSGASRPLVTSHLTSIARLRWGWHGCELRHLLASTHYNLAVREAYPSQELNRRGREGKFGSAASGKFDSLQAFKTQCHTSAEWCCFCRRFDVTSFGRIHQVPTDNWFIRFI